MTGTTQLVAVHLLGFPLAVYDRAQEYMDGLLREFALLAIDPPMSVPGHQVPHRLLELVDALQVRFAGFTDAPSEQRDQALDAGLDTIDLVYHVPPEAKAASQALDALLDEADQFCRDGELLTLAALPEVLRFRRWYLGEFIAQIDGADPTPWADH